MPSTAPQSDTQWGVVTGSSRGIGRAIALELAADGFPLLLHGRDQAALEDVRRQVVDLGNSCEIFCAALEQPAERALLVERAWACGRVAAWINNAGADVLTGDLAPLSFDEKLHQLWQVDVAATIDLCRRVGQKMKQAGHGVILNMGWDQAETGMEGDSGEMFAAAKGAVMAFSRSAAKSLAPEVRVNCLAPGWIGTGWSEEASPYWQRRAKAESLSGRWGAPSDIAQVARFLVSPDANFINGQIISINGGFAGSVEPNVESK
ncbi:MAG: SDR family oxidoreductase [Planctomycetota bacterium]